MEQGERELGVQTRLIHRGREANDTRAVSPPIWQTSTYVVPTPQEGADLASQVAPATFYTRYGSPNTKQVEAVLADLEGAEAALALGSGMAAVTAAILSNVQSGDHIVAQRTHYTAAFSLLTDTLPRYGIEVTQVDQRDTDGFARAMRSNTRILYTESPTNPTMDLTDLEATARIAHTGGALAITDNTFASSYNQQPLSWGYDLVVHSATKYLNGHADATAGIVAGTRAEIDKVWEYARIHGPVLHPFEAWLLYRGLRTYGLRMAAHNHNAMKVAGFLADHPAIACVHYPGLPSHPQHELARRQMTGGFGGMLSFEMKNGYDAAATLLEQTKLCLMAVSLGGLETLMTHPASMIHTHQTDEQRATGGITPGLVRLSVGAEVAEDLIADLEQALARL